MFGPNLILTLNFWTLSSLTFKIEVEWGKLRNEGNWMQIHKAVTSLAVISTAVRSPYLGVILG